MIGYYAHHLGVGHLQRAVAVSSQLGPQMTLLSSAEPPSPMPHLRLASDANPPVEGDVTASSALHWAPLQHSGFRQRSSQIAHWAEEHRAALLVSDVSVEVLLLARLLSIPPVAVAMRGQRRDRAHELGYDVSRAIVAPWPRATHGRWPQRWLDKTVWVGPVSRFDGRARVAGRCEWPGRCVLVLLGRGGDSMTEASLREAHAVPGTHWHVLGGSNGLFARHGSPTDADGRVERLGWVVDPWPLLCRADVVVAAAGDAAVADVAAAGRPLIAVPQDRPFAEQQEHATVLARHWLCIPVPTWPDRHDWPHLLDRAESLGGSGWSAYYDGGGSARMAAALLELAEKRPGSRVVASDRQATRQRGATDGQSNGNKDCGQTAAAEGRRDGSQSGAPEAWDRSQSRAGARLGVG